MKHTKQALFHSIVALILCCSMLVGTTFAWFTDEVTSGVNKIQAGNLDIELEYLDGGDWKPVKSDKSVFPEGILWEPGHTEVVYLRIVNKGNLALKYQLGIGVEGETLSVTESGEVIQLSKYIHFGAVDGVSAPFADRDAARAAVTESKALTAGYTKTGTMTATNETAYMALVVYMPESVGNEANHATGADAPSIDLGIRLLATQLGSEMDSFGSDYDVNAAWPYMSIKRSITRSISGKIDAATGNLTETIVFGDADDAQRAEIPADVKLAAGADELTFSITSMEKPNADVNTKTRDEILRSIDIHVEGVAEDNTVPMTFVLKELFPKGLNDNNVKLYHVEGDETKEMTIVATPVNHNEFSYDPLTGDAVVTIATFSEVATYADTNAPWDGKTYDYSWYKADGDLTIGNANQFAAFRNIVDGVEINGVYTIDDFKDQKITLGADINLNGHNFDPIGWGYDNTAWNAGGAEGKVFKGHFNGNYKTIYGLLQSGWDLTNDATGKPYTYTNCGFGLFAAALDATFENLTIDGANIRVECVETGVLVGLAQGSCTFRNINILGCKAANYQRPVGGVVGEVSPKMVDGVAQTGEASKHTFDNVYVDSNTVIGSLWGDFDAPVGGVIGAYWDDAGVTTVVMDQVTVACRLDVYNDVTSTYQWYAYRRAGMLIGDSDSSLGNPRDGRTAKATYLTCSDVIVFYGDWANYHYCEFHDSNPNWPWVRVEPGENCSGYNNPRWGNATDPVTKTPVVDSVHNHGTGEGHMQSIPFHQLYGGGQGVYGEDEHKNVSEGIYTVTYMDHGEILHVDYVTDNRVAYGENDIWPVTNVKDANNNSPSCWVDANSKEFTGVGIGNTANVIIYPKWPNEYTVRCIDTYGNVAYYNFFTDDKTTAAEYEAIATEINNTLATIQKEIDANGKVVRVVWKDASGKLLTTTDANGNVVPTEITSDYIAKAGSNIILTATPQLLSGSITLTPVYDDTTGELVAYHVTDVVADDSNISIMIPDYVGTVPVTKITEGAFDDFDNLHAVVIPNTVTTLDKSMFPGSLGIISNRQTVTIYYEGTKAQWDALNKVDSSQSGLLGSKTDTSWDNTLGKGSRVFFLGANGKVDITQGYLEVTDIKGISPTDVVWTYNATITQTIKEACTANCDCKEVCKGDKQRPDAIYWEGVTIN